MSTSNQEPQNKARPRLLVLDYWGIGDLALATAFIKEAIRHYEVTLLVKGYGPALLAPSFPEVKFMIFQAPWTAFRNKYQLWKWPWKMLFKIWWLLLRTRFDAAVSVRSDPRDHFMMWLIRARRRFGFSTKGSGILLNHAVRRSVAHQHKIEDWMDLARAMDIPVSLEFGPWLNSPAYVSAKVDALFDSARKPVFAVHAGGSQMVKRLPEEYLRNIIQFLRASFPCTLILIPDPDGYGKSLSPLCDITVEQLKLPELVRLLGKVDLFICNDSGPGHIASCCQTPVISFFGPADPVLFRPWGENNLVVSRDVCEWRPCWDNCKFAEPICMLALRPNEVWPEIEQHIKKLIIPSETHIPKTAADRVVVVIATFRRPTELARLIVSLKASRTPIHGLVVADNASDAATKSVIETSGLPCRYIACPENLGCGGGLSLAEETALRDFPDLTHVWIMDDDVAVEADTLEILLQAMKEQGAGCSCPQSSDETGRLDWFPGLLDSAKFDVVRSVKTPAAYLEKCGPDPVPFSWATGVSLLVTKSTFLRAGFHRKDFWVRGEDLDFALRLTRNGKGIFVPTAHVTHYSPGKANPKNFGERLKNASMLQNCALLFSHTPHGRSLFKHWPGNAFRHISNTGLNGIGDVIRAFYYGAIRGRAAGDPNGNYFQKQLNSKH